MMFIGSVLTPNIKNIMPWQGCWSRSAEGAAAPLLVGDYDCKAKKFT